MAVEDRSGDVRELLEWADTDSRHSYYRAGSVRWWFYATVALLFLGLAVFGIWFEKPTGYILVLLGVQGLMIVAVMLGLRTRSFK
jgi:hypothetical protein